MSMATKKSFCKCISGERKTRENVGPSKSVRSHYYVERKLKLLGYNYFITPVYIYQPMKKYYQLKYQLHFA